jgi:hypothetical protein
MTLRTVAAFGAAAIFMLLPTVISAKTDTIPFPTLGSSGEEVPGPRTFRITQINAFRYAGVLITDKHTLSVPPDVFGEITSTANLSTAGAGKTTLQMLSQQLELTLTPIAPPVQIPLHTAKAREAIRRATELVDDIRTCTDSGGSEVIDIVLKADPLGSATDDAYKKQIEDLLSGKALKSARSDLAACVGEPLAKQWPTANLRIASNEIALARALHEDKDTGIRDLLKTLDDERTALQPVASAEIYGAVAKQYDALRTWSVVLNGVTSFDQFHADKEIRCANRLKADSVLISIDAYDRTVGDVTKSKQTKEIKTVDCPSALSVSHGFGFSSIPLQRFKVGSAFVNGSGVSSIQYDRNDNGRPYLMSAIGHYEILRGDPVSLHLSLSATTSQSEIVGGMVGLSLSFHRALYVTAGVFRSDVESLQNGYTVGQAVPSSLTLSTTKNAVNRFGLAISFPIIKGESGKATTTRGGGQGGGSQGNGSQGNAQGGGMH